jgi:integrase
MPRQTRLLRRNGRYYLKAWVPEDVRDLIKGGKSGQKWVALGTSDAKEAPRLLRIKSVEFDQEVAAARRKIHGSEDEITQAEADRLASIWLSQELEEDERVRRDGMGEADLYLSVKKQVEADGGVSLFNEQEVMTEFGLSDREVNKLHEGTDFFREVIKDALGRGDVGPIADEVDELLDQEGFIVERNSPSWRRVAFAILKAEARVLDLKAKRNEGELVETPPIPKTALANDRVTVQELIDAYMNDPSSKRTTSTTKTYQTVFRALKEMLGADTPVDSTHRRDCERIRDVVMRLPKNATKRYPGLTLEKIADIADTHELERIKPGTVNAYLGNLSSLFKWGVKTWRVDRNPAEGLMVNDPVQDIDKKQPFSVNQLTTIFTAPLYTGCKNDEGGYATPGPNVIRRGRFWVPLLSLWTGMRAGECCQLHVNDIVELEGVPCVLITDTGETGEDEADRKRVKTIAGRRFVPIHPELQRIGFLDLVEEMRARKEKRLFPEIGADAQGYVSGSFGKWFNDKRRFLGKLGIAGTGVSFHSFRHNYRDALREADMSLERVRALGGWRRDSDGEEARYGTGLTASSLYREIQKVSYPGLDLSHLHVR